VRVACSALAVAVAASLLWARQTPRSLLGVDSFGAAVAAVVFWSLPTLLVYVLFARSVRATVVGGAALVITQAWCWWTFATDPHSTASVGPGALGWIAGPVAALFWWLGQRLVRDAVRDA
jgi:hypothetical protein